MTFCAVSPVKIVIAVFSVADERITYMREMRAYLVSFACIKSYRENGSIPVRKKHFITRFYRHGTLYGLIENFNRGGNRIF